MKREELERRLVEFVSRIQPAADPPIVVDQETALFEEGVINSLRILDLIAFVEESTGTRVPDEAVRLANFRSVSAIAAAFGEKECGARDHAACAPADERAVIHVFERRSQRAGFACPVRARAWASGTPISAMREIPPCLSECRTLPGPPTLSRFTSLLQWAQIRG